MRGENGKVGVRFASLIDGRIGSADKQAAQPCCVFWWAYYDYCIQSLGCTAEEAAKAEGKLLPSIAERLTQTQIDWPCACWLAIRRST